MRDRRPASGESGEEELVRGVLDGTPGAFDGLVDRYQDRLFTYFLRRTGDWSLAEDLYQDLFIRVYRGLRSYQHEERFDAWLFTIARRLVVDWSRKPRGDRSTGPEDRDPRPGPDEIMDESGSSRDLARAVLDLPDDQRDVVCLHYYGGLTFVEIAGILETPLGTIQSRMHRAIPRLRASLKFSGKPAATGVR